MKTYLLDRDDLLTVATAALGEPPDIRDFGLLDSALARPASSAFGIDSYPTLFDKAAALLHSLARNHALLDGNKRTAWAAAWTFLGANGIVLKAGFDVDAAERLMIDAATGSAELGRIAPELEGFAERPSAQGPGIVAGQNE